MASEAKKDKADQTALDAVEKALSIDFEGEIASKDGSIEIDDLNELEQSLADAAESLLTEDEKPVSASLSEGSPSDLSGNPLEPANDQDTAPLDAALMVDQEKPKGRAFLWATLISLVWLGVSLYFGNQLLLDREPGSGLASIISDQNVLMLLAVALVPLLFIWGGAAMLRRAEELHLAANSLNRASIRLLQPEAVASDSVATVGTAIRREVTAIGDGVERALARAGELEFMVQKEVMNLERSYGDSELKLRRLLEDIGNERQQVIGHAELLKNTIAETKTDFSHDVEAASSKIAETIRTSTTEVTDALDSKGYSLNESVRNASEQVIETVEKASSELNSNVESTRQTLQQDLTKNIRELNELFSISGRAIGTMSQNLGEKLDAGKKAFEITFDSRKEELNSLLSDTGKDITSLISSTTEKFAEERNRLNSQAAEATKAFSDQADVVAKQMEENLTIRAEAFDSRLSETADGLEARFTSMSDSLIGALGNRTEALDRALKDGTANIGQTIAQRLSGFSESLSKHIDDTANTLRQQTESIKSDSLAVVDHSVEKLAQHAQTISDTSKSVINNSIEQLDKHANSIEASTKTAEEIISRRAKSVEDTIKESTIAFADGLSQQIQATNEKSQALSEQLKEASDQLAQRVDASTASLNSVVSERAEKAAEEIEDKVGALEARLQQNSASVEKQFEAGNAVLDELMSRGQASLIEKVSGSIQSAGQAIDEKAQKLTEILSERAALINSTLGSSLVDAQRELEAKTDEFNTMLGNRVEKLSGIVENNAKPIIANIEATSASVEKHFSSLSRAISEDANSVFADLATANEQLETLVRMASTNLNLLQDDVNSRAASFATTINQSTSDLEAAQKIANETEERLKSASSSLLQNMGGIAGRIEAQGTVLRDATRLIDAAQNDFESTLESKQEVLHDLSEGLLTRSTEINKALSAFETVITGLMEGVQAQTRGLGSSVSAEITNAVDDATARFSETVDAMRTAAGNIRSELEETREQMRRGVLELPDETAQNATAMRRVVTDQIAALKDLSSIVQRSGKLLDTSTPLATLGSVAGQVGTNRVAPNTQSQQPPARQTAPQGLPPRAAPKFPPATTPRSNSPRFDDRLRSSIPPQSATSSPSNQRDRGGSASQSSSDRGWVSDLLRRASDIEQQQPKATDNRSPDQFVDSLNSQSIDITSAIDHDASVELWERYQRGETNVFTRRLYTLQGQHTFDEIRNKYASDGDFRNAVDRYIEDFERLLVDVSKTDTDGSLSQSYLTSDNGKVYTMLAHASGRFDRV